MYLYRFDPIETLRAQRRDDPMLRARRTFGTEPHFPHVQTIEEINRSSADEGVFRMSFWKTWDDLRANLWAHRTGWVIQRVHKDHEALRHFKRDHDEYLKTSAWLYWAAMPLTDAGDQWSSVGIPHSDIEILHPSGQWVSMDAVPALSDIAGDGWDTYTLSTFADAPTPLWTISCTRESDRSGTTWVVLRQPSGPWAAWLGNPTPLNPLLLRLAERGAFNPLSARWIYAVEYSEDIVATEIFPVFKHFREPGLRGWWNRLRGRAPQRQWELFHDDAETDFLSDREMEALYEDLGLGEALRRGRRWSYEHLVPNFDELEERKGGGVPVVSA